MIGRNYILDPYPKAWRNPVNLRASAALPAAGAWDAAPTEQNIAGAGGIELAFTYTRGAAGGAFNWAFQYSIYSVAALVPAGGSEWQEGAIYAPGAVVAGVDTQSLLQVEFIGFTAVGAAAESFLWEIEILGPIERIRIPAQETGVVGTPGTLQITATIR